MPISGTWIYKKSLEDHLKWTGLYDLDLPQKTDSCGNFFHSKYFDVFSLF